MSQNYHCKTQFWTYNFPNVTVYSYSESRTPNYKIVNFQSHSICRNFCSVTRYFLVCKFLIFSGRAFWHAIIQNMRFLTTGFIKYWEGSTIGMFPAALCHNSWLMITSEQEPVIFKPRFSCLLVLYDYYYLACFWY